MGSVPGAHVGGTSFRLGVSVQFSVEFSCADVNCAERCCVQWLWSAVVGYRIVAAGCPEECFIFSSRTIILHAQLHKLMNAPGPGSWSCIAKCGFWMSEDGTCTEYLQTTFSK
jgi:hypothetical protein